MPRQVMAHYAAMTTNWSGSQSYVSSLRVGVKRLYRQEWWRRLMIGGRNASSIGGRTVNSEVTEAFSRWLAGAPEWSHNAFLCLRNEIGLGLLVVENAERLAAKSEATRAEAMARYAKAKALSGVIPFGQPVIAGHHSQGRHLRDLAKIRNGIGAAVDGLNEADRLADAARSAETTGERLADPARRMARLVAIDRELSGPMTSERRRERLEAEREALDAQLDRAIFASAETVRKGDIVRFKGQRAAVVRVNKTSVSVGHWQYGTGTGERFGPVDRPLIPVDPETGKPWKYTDRIGWHLIESVQRDGQVVFERGKQ